MIRVSTDEAQRIYVARDRWRNGKGRPQHAVLGDDLRTISWRDHPEGGDMEPLGQGPRGLELVGQILGIVE